jgi:hypothetical protein
MAQAEWKESTDLINAAVRILEAENPMTIRQLFYRLVSIHAIMNETSDYQKVIRLMTKARKDGRVDYDWIVDRSRASYKSVLWDNMSELADSFERTLLRYRSDWWQDQPTYIEIWCEKDAVTGSIDPVRIEYGLRVESFRGYNSTTNLHECVERLMDRQDAGKNLVILYLGDWDPSGEDMVRDVQDRLAEENSDLDVEVVRVAIHKEDIAAFNLPPLRTKKKDDGSWRDSRAKKFVKAHGNMCVELDALPAVELRFRLKEEIENNIVFPMWERAKVAELAQRETNKMIAAKIKDMVNS